MVDRETALSVIERPASGWALAVTDMRERVQAITQLYRDVMIRGVDYDVLPQTKKPTILQPGCQVLDLMAGYAPTFEETPKSIRDWQAGYFYVQIKCRLISKATGEIVAEAIGSCNSKEEKYRWRYVKPLCPECKTEAIRRSKQEYGGGYFCDRKGGGCGRSFKADDARITEQPVGRAENTEPFDLLNTIEKMAQIRAHRAATLNATGASRIFTQDADEVPVPAEDVPDEAPAPQKAATQAKPATAAAAKPQQPARPAAAKPADDGEREQAMVGWRELWNQAVKLGMHPSVVVKQQDDAAIIAQKCVQLAALVDKQRGVADADEAPGEQAETAF